MVNEAISGWDILKTACMTLVPIPLTCSDFDYTAA